MRKVKFSQTQVGRRRARKRRLHNLVQEFGSARAFTGMFSAWARDSAVIMKDIDDLVFGKGTETAVSSPSAPSAALRLPASELEPHSARVITKHFCSRCGVEVREACKVCTSGGLVCLECYPDACTEDGQGAHVERRCRWTKSGGGI